MKVPIPQDWLGEYCCFSVEWPDSPEWKAILVGQLTAPARGRFYDEKTGNIRLTQDIIRATYDNNLLLPGVIMACNSPELSEIAAALRLIAANQCCAAGPPANGGIQVVVTTPGDATIPLYGSVPPATLPSGEVPPDYQGTVEEYNADKCRTAHLIVSGLVGSLNNLAHFNFAITTGVIVTVLGALAGIIILPEFLIPALIGAGIVLVLETHLLSDLAAAIEAERDDIVCFMYTSDNTEQVMELISDTIDVLIAGLATTTLLGAALKTIALVLVNTDTINQLFTLVQGLGDVDVSCISCGSSGEFVTRTDASDSYVPIDTFPVPTTGFFPVEALFHEGVFWHLLLQVNEPFVGVKVEFQNLVGWTPTVVDATPFEVGQETNGSIFNGTTFGGFQAAAAANFLTKPVNPLMRQWYIVSATVFTVEIKLTLEE